MKNREKFSNEIADIACSCKAFAVEKRTGEIVYCQNLECEDCLFYNSEIGCVDAKRNWAEAEYEEPMTAKRLREKFEQMCEYEPTCDGCKYYTQPCPLCFSQWILDNYNITEKGEDQK